MQPETTIASIEIAPIVTLLVAGILVVQVLRRSVRIVPNTQVEIVERLGRYARTLGPGLHTLVPLLDSVKATIDMRRQEIQLPDETATTSDGAELSFVPTLVYTVQDPVRATYEDETVIHSINMRMADHLRALLATRTLEQTLTSRDDIHRRLRDGIEEAARQRGIRIDALDLKAIDPPMTLDEARERQRRAWS